jgi:hypothetical protein
MGMTTYFFNQFQFNSHNVRIIETSTTFSELMGDSSNRKIVNGHPKKEAVHTKTQHGSGNIQDVSRFIVKKTQVGFMVF